MLADDLPVASSETCVTRGKLIKLLKPPFLHLGTGNNHTGLSRSHAGVVEGNQMRFLKSIHWQRALHKRQVFLLLSAGLPLGTYRPKAVLPAPPWLHRPHPLHLHLFRHCLSAPQRSWVSPPPPYISGPGSWAPLAPRGTVVSSSWQQWLPRRPPPCAPSFGTATGPENRPMGALGSSLTAQEAANRAEPGKGAQCWG